MGRRADEGKVRDESLHLDEFKVITDPRQCSLSPLVGGAEVSPEGPSSVAGT